MMRVMVITGMSGAGKSQALKRLEDMGYFCVDNLPCEMLGGFALLCKRANPPVEKVAVVIDSRESIFGNDVVAALDKLAALEVSYQIIFLECRDEVLERRYNETRRPHPLGGDIRKAIQAERELLSTLRARADHIIDTSQLRPLELRQALEQALSQKDTGFALEIVSFGYKRGVPFEADVVLDMRFSPNPFYEPELRALSGRDAAVQAFVLADENVTALLDQVEHTLERLIPRFIEQEKRRLMVAFGCTGGRHRSVCCAEALYHRMKDRYQVSLAHRDIATEAASIRERGE